MTRIVDWVLSALGSAAGFALSWPFWRDFEYFADSRDFWWVYFVVGYLMGVYVFYVFIACTRMLFLHDHLIKTGVIEPGPTLEETETDKKGKQ